MLKIYIILIKAHNGLGVIDWHVKTSYPGNSGYLYWGRAYLEILDFLSKEKEIWVTNLEETAGWLRGRRIALKKEAGGNKEGAERL